MNLYDFNPPKNSILIGNENLELSSLSLKFLVQIRSKYKTLEEFQKILNSSLDTKFSEEFSNTLVWLTYQLLEDKNNFKSINDFGYKFLNEKEKIYLGNVESIFKTIRDSQPIVAENSITVGKHNENDQEYFSRVYVCIAKEIGFTIDQFYNLTLRQINQIQIDLNYFKTNDLNFLASIHGVKLKNSNSETSDNFSKKEGDVLMAHAKKRMEQLKNERNSFNDK